MRFLTALPWRLEKVFIPIDTCFGNVLEIVSREAELPQQAAGAWQNEPLARLGIFCSDGPWTCCRRNKVGLLSSISYWIAYYKSRLVDFILLLQEVWR